MASNIDLKLNHINLKSEIDKKQKARLVNFLLSDALALILSGANLDIINQKVIFRASAICQFSTSSPGWSQSLTRGVLQTVTVTFWAVWPYSMKQFFM